MKLILALIVAAAAAGAVVTLPDIKRYMKMRQM